MKTKLFFTVVIGLCQLVGLVRADISPTQYRGSGIVPVRAPGIRMASAKVDIEWGTPCVLSAVFMMENTTAQPVDVQLGFPLSLPDKYTEKDKLDFAMSFNDVPAKSSEITEVGKPKINFPMEETWYRCQHTFPPGQTKVTVKTKLPASLDYNWPCRENIDYCIQTGGQWMGTIGSEEVNIHFPGPVAPSQIFEGSPSGYTINGDTVHWMFKDFKPQGKEYDIHLEYMRPDVVESLARLHKAVAKDPANSKLILQLAKDLFALGSRKGYAGYPPSHLSKAEFDSLAGKIKNEKDRAVFQSSYAVNDKGLYEEKTSEWTPERQDMVRIIAETDYEPAFDKSAQVDEARDLVSGVLKAEPHNAEAWVVYLAHFGDFRFAGSEYYQPQIDAISKAHSLCPKDACIELWYQRSKLGSTRFAQSTLEIERLDKQISALLKQQGAYQTDFRKIDYGYW